MVRGRRPHLVKVDVDKGDLAERAEARLKGGDVRELLPRARLGVGALR